MSKTEDKIDFLGVGDIVVEPFIRLEDAHIHDKIDSDTSSELCVRFGDKVPYESAILLHAVGNSPNAARAASRLGLRSAIVTNIGNDRHGEGCIESLKKDKIGTDYVAIEKNKLTNYHYVLWHNVDRTILVKHTEFNYAFPEIKQEVAWMYLSSLAPNSLEYHRQIALYLQNNPQIKLALQPGTFQIKLGTEKLKDIYERAEILFCNAEEAETILEKENKSANRDFLELSKAIHALGPKIVVISDGPKGSYCYGNGELWHIPMYPDIAPAVERTGAGDAFSATVVSAIILGKTLPEALVWGSINAMSVVQYVGAQEGLLPREKIEGYLKNAPADYKAKKIN